ncbi:MAG: LLM class flavin-dependent oxidoreductase [Steroidobacteraceae bacterium]
MIHPWVFEFLNSFVPVEPEGFDPQACAADFAWYLDLWTGFEDAGFEGVFFSEHHFAYRSLSPSPNLLVAATAARTRRLRLGTMGNVVPFYEPWRLAEEYSMLDHLSGGRLEIGLSSGVGPREFRAVGLPEDEMRPRFAEALDIIDAALTQPRITHHGRFWNFDDLAVAPRPLQQPTPRRWMTGLGLPTAQLAAQRGCCFCTGFLANERVRAVFEGLSRGGGGGRPACRPAAPRAAAPGIHRRRRGDGAGAVAAEAAGPAGRDGPRAGDRRRVGAGCRRSGAWSAMRRRSAARRRRSPSRSSRSAAASGAGHFLGYLFGGYTREQVRRSYELWRQVIPVLRRANLEG